jgi:hypothetical protein
MNLAALRENLLKPSVKLRYKFLYNSTDYTSMITKNGMGTIRRDINLSAGKALVTLNNSGGWWNFLHETNTALGETAEVQVYVDGDVANAYTLIKGTVLRPDFEGSTVTLTIKDHNAKFLDKKVGSNESPATWYSGNIHNTADAKVWRLLTTDGGLSSLASPANTDIDYASFVRWRDDHLTANGYTIRGRPRGHSVAECLMIIAQMTHSYIWVNNDGYVEFAPPFEPGFSYDEGNTGSRRKPGHGRDLELRDDLIINDVTVRRGYSWSDGSWVGSVNDTDATSIAKFGTFPKTIEGRIFWHIGDATSATADRDATLTNYAYPLRFFHLITGFPALMEDLGREITVSDTLKGISSESAYVERIVYDLNTWEIEIKARWPW